jgi:hypothetical protein
VKGKEKTEPFQIRYQAGEDVKGQFLRDKHRKGKKA